MLDRLRQLGDLLGVDEEAKGPEGLGILVHQPMAQISVLLLFILLLEAEADEVGDLVVLQGGCPEIPMSQAEGILDPDPMVVQKPHRVQGNIVFFGGLLLQDINQLFEPLFFLDLVVPSYEVHRVGMLLDVL